jgi:hypothetical protein
MDRIFPRLLRLFLAAALIVGGALVHLDSAAHADSSDAGVAHGHASHEGDPGSADLSKDDQDSPSHALGFCIDAHCCTPAVHIAAHDGLRHPLESGKLVFGPASNYSLSVALSLLNPPRAIT